MVSVFFCGNFQNKTETDNSTLPDSGDSDTPVVDNIIVVIIVGALIVVGVAVFVLVYCCMRPAPYQSTAQFGNELQPVTGSVDLDAMDMGVSVGGTEYQSVRLQEASAPLPSSTLAL